MNMTTEVVILLCCLGVAALGVAGVSSNERTTSNWMAGLGLLGAIVWLCWIFMRPSGESFAQFWGMIRDFLNAN